MAIWKWNKPQVNKQTVQDWIRSCFCRSSTHRLALALASMLKKTPPAVRAGRGKGRKDEQELSEQSADPFWECSFISQCQAGRARWAFKITGIVCPANVCSQSAGTLYCLQSSCNRQRSDPQLGNVRWKEKQKTQNNRRLTQQFKTFFGMLPAFLYYMHREPDLPLKEHAAWFA